MRMPNQLLLSAVLGACACVFAACAAVDRDDQRDGTVVASYATVVQPILERRCVACHGAVKPKGRLRLDTPEGLRAGGVGGYTIVAGRAGESELVRRLHLPHDDEEHMPPVDKPQPTADEISALAAWIDAGAPFEGHVAELAPYALASAPVPSADMLPASGAALAALREALVHVEPVEPGSNGLCIDFSAIAVKVDDALAEQMLGPVREQVVDLSLARAAIGDTTLALVADMPHLERLDVRGTAITSSGLAHLVRLADLRELVVAQTELNDAALDTLIACTSLERVFLWRSGLGAAAVTRLRAERPDLFVDAGDTPDATIAEVEPQVRFSNEAPLPGAPLTDARLADPAETPVNANCPITGTPVDPTITVVHAGRVIGFCCANCRAEFAKDPERHAAQLP